MAQPHLYYDSRELWLHPPSSKDHHLEPGMIKRAFDFYRGGGTSFEDAATEYEEYEEGYGDGEEEDEMMVQLVGEEGEEGAAGGKSRKKARRLSSQQVKALEMAFDANNKLEAERKVALASKVGLEPRQVAVWFQNRRARWKTKQMEGDFIALKTRFQALKAERDALLKDKQLLEDQVACLKNQGGGKKQQVAEETHMNVVEACMNNSNMNNIIVANKPKDDLDLHISNTRLSYSDNDDGDNNNDNDDKEESSISIANASPKKRMVSFNSATLETAQYRLSQIPASADSDSGSSRPASSIHFRYIKGEEEGGLCEETRTFCCTQHDGQLHVIEFGVEESNP